MANACSSGLGGLVLNVNYSRGGDARLLRTKQFFFLLQVNEADDARLLRMEQFSFSFR